MVADPADLVLDRVGERLRSLSPTPSQFSIFRVPSQLRKINETTYEPEMLAIGPYHGKDHLMEKGFEVYLLHRLSSIFSECLINYVK